MDDSVAGVVLAAGAGRRLSPLSRILPKALCPVGGVPLVDLALARLAPWAGSLAVNLHHGAALVDAHLDPSVHRSIEEPEALGTAGALGALRPWIEGRGVLVANADAWHGPEVDVERFVAEWDHERVRLLCVEAPGRADFSGLRYCGIALLPWALVAGLDAVPSGLYEVMWRNEDVAGRLDLVRSGAPFIDCGTPRDYLDANLAASGGRSVVDQAAEVGEGAEVVRSVVWAGGVVAPGARLVDAVVAPGVTVLVR